MADTEARPPSSLGRQASSLRRTAPAAMFHRDSIRTPTAAQLREEEAELRRAKEDAMAHPAVDLPRVPSTFGAGLGLGFGRKSPSFSVSSGPRFTSATAVPRGLASRDARVPTELCTTLPGAIGRQPSSTMRSTIGFTIRGSTDRLFPGIPLSPIKGGNRDLLSKPYPVSKSLYDPDKLHRTKSEEGAAPSPPGVTVSSLGRQSLSSCKSQPKAVIGTASRGTGFVVTETTVGPYRVDNALRATRPRVKTAACDAAGRRDGKPRLDTDWDFRPAGVPAPGTYAPERSLPLVKKKSPSFAMGKPKQRAANDIFRF